MSEIANDIFISYSRKDKAIADKICAALDREGITYFIDRKGISGGAEFSEVLADAISDCKIFLFLASKNAYESTYTQKEISFAVDEKKDILPYIIDGSQLPKKMRFQFANLNRRNITDHPIDTILIADLCNLLGREPKLQPIKISKNLFSKFADFNAEIFNNLKRIGNRYRYALIVGAVILIGIGFCIYIYTPVTGSVDLVNQENYNDDVATSGYDSVDLVIQENSNGNVTTSEYDYVDSICEGLARVRLNGKYGFIDKNGNEVIPLKYDAASSFSEGLARVRLNGKWGFIDKNGNEVIPLKYDSADSFSEGLARVRLNGKHGFIDKDGNEVIPLKYDSADDSFSEGLAYVRLNGKWGFIDKSGNEITPLKYDYADSFREGLAIVRLSGKFGFIDKQGNEVIPLKYDLVWSFCKGLALVELNGERFYIDKQGNKRFYIDKYGNKVEM